MEVKSVGKIKNEIIISKRCPEPLKNVVLITGQLRGPDYLEKLENIKKMTSSLQNISYYLLTWDYATVKSNIFGSLPLYANWSMRLPKPDHPFPDGLKTIEQLKDNMPLTYEKLRNNVSIEKVNIGALKNIFPKGNIEIFDEQKFNSEFEKFSNLKTRGGSLNQAKMFFLINEGLKKINKLDDQNINILKIRPETVFLTKFENKNLQDSPYIYAGNIENALIQDAEFFGRKESILRMYGEICYKIFDSKSFYIFKINDKKVAFDSHKLLKTHLIQKEMKFLDISRHTQFRRKVLYECFNFEIPFLEEEINNDLRNSKLDKNTIKQIKKAFTSISKNS